MNRRAKTAFGEFLVGEIKKAGMSQEEFYKAVKIAKPYFYDILNATPPPDDVQERMITQLESKTGADENRRKKFYDLAARGRNEIPVDIAKMFFDNPDKWDLLRDNINQLIHNKTGE